MSKTRKVVRSAISGRFVKKGRAKSNPRTTITQHVRVPRRRRGR